MKTTFKVEQTKDSEIVLVTFKCPLCEKEHSMFLTKKDIEQYINEKDSKSIQDIFPGMSPEDREKFLSGFCSDCQKLIFG